jgi:PAS domain S-box-containing protein
MRWPAVFQRAREALFLLNPQRRVLFVNAAWESLTGLPAAEARGRVCKRYPHAEPGSWEATARALAPPAEVLAGQAARLRRLGGGQIWWQIDYFPLHDADGLLAILGKVTPLSDCPRLGQAALPEELVHVRDRAAHHFGLEQLASRLPAMARVVDQVRLAGQGRVPVLIHGEAGSGKRWLARCIHSLGERTRFFAAVDASRLPPAALTHVLFGEHGLLPRPATVYLQSPAALPRELQARLADWLAGEPRPPANAARLLAGCSSDPADDLKQGRLLEELLVRLDTIRIELPPLRQRLADLPDLARTLLGRAAELREATGDSQAKKLDLTPDAWKLLADYSWPGNLAELYSVLAAAARHARGEAIDVADLPAHLRQAAALGRLASPTPVRPIPLDPLLEQVERRLIELALRMARGNKSRAADLLQIWRARLLRRMQVLGIADVEEEN